ncbi:MAG: Cna B-type domain-containing protein, partial [Tissierellia bacterium]|nr:Cna B-type domain-containing protein [Tissierellia bacterium]
ESNADGFEFTPPNYKFEISLGDEEYTFIATNTFTSPNDVTVEVEKIWHIDTLDEGLTLTYPTMLFTLYRKTATTEWELVPGAAVIEIDENNTEAKWENLARMDGEANIYIYIVEETFKDDDILNDNWVEEQDESGNIINRLIYNDPEDEEHDDEKVANLTIKKIVCPDSAISNKEFSVKVTGPYGYEKIIKIKHGQSKKLEELYYGKYTVTEINTEGYAVDYSEKEVTLRKSNPSAVITITNKKLAPDTKVIVGKKVWTGYESSNYSRPDIWFKLQRRVGSDSWVDVKDSIKKVPTSDEVSWTVEIKNSSGKEYSYRVKEVDKYGADYVPKGFTKVEDGLTVRNYKEGVIIPPITGGGTPKLNKRDHFGYVIGYPPGDFRPENTITRGEMTAIFARLLEEKIFLNKDYPIPFSDVARSSWYAEYIGMLTQVGVISGYPDGTFRPENPVTRAEFATVASRFISSKKTGFGGFPDVSNQYWARESIEAAYAEGWLKGYPDGSFRPERNLSRAEAVTIINRMLDRVADKSYVDTNARSIVKYTDLTKVHWAYYDIMEASNSHDYERLTNKNERWLRHWRPY